MPTFGVIFHPRFPPKTLIQYARRAEEAGFSEFWLWDDCFLPGAFTLAGVALAATEHLKVGIGLLPATVYNPLFAAMEITSLACAFPGRFLPGFGHGVGPWMKQIGAVPLSSMKTLEQTVHVVRALLRGDRISVHADGIDLDDVQMELIPDQPPPLYVGAMREKSLQLAGRIADGTILTGMSSPPYTRWAKDQILAGNPNYTHPIAVYTHAKISADGKTARAAVRQNLTTLFPWADVHLKTLGISDEAHALYQTYGAEMADHIPDAWIDELAAAGTPEQAAASIERLVNAGADTIILQPDDPACLDDYIRYLLPLFS
jgi:alkanesulfonate monooxygenase SsuD/methylene tetrahydromethanopterin reductase-like flavin-dependent oxidoreductase (luciferase family)